MWIPVSNDENCKRIKAILGFFILYLLILSWKPAWGFWSREDLSLLIYTTMLFPHYLSSLQSNVVRARCYSAHTLVLNYRWVSPTPTKKKKKKKESGIYIGERGSCLSFLWESFLKSNGRIRPSLLKCLYSPESQLPWNVNMFLWK